MTFYFGCLLKACELFLAIASSHHLKHEQSEFRSQWTLRFHLYLSAEPHNAQKYCSKSIRYPIKYRKKCMSDFGLNLNELGVSIVSAFREIYNCR